ncbi:MAG: hypothetical protein OXM03_09970 [Chloroflexota bacterium]|nr:hypothetical protein [Chloroflexota bacterium]
MTTWRHWWVPVPILWLVLVIIALIVLVAVGGGLTKFAAILFLVSFGLLFSLLYLGAGLGYKAGYQLGGGTGTGQAVGIVGLIIGGIVGLLASLLIVSTGFVSHGLSTPFAPARLTEAQPISGPGAPPERAEESIEIYGLPQATVQFGENGGLSGVEVSTFLAGQQFTLGLSEGEISQLGVGEILSASAIESLQAANLQHIQIIKGPGGDIDVYVNGGFALRVSVNYDQAALDKVISLVKGLGYDVALPDLAVPLALAMIGTVAVDFPTADGAAAVEKFSGETSQPPDVPGATDPQYPLLVGTVLNANGDLLVPDVVILENTAPLLEAIGLNLSMPGMLPADTVAGLKEAGLSTITVKLVPQGLDIYLDDIHALTVFLGDEAALQNLSLVAAAFAGDEAGDMLGSVAPLLVRRNELAVDIVVNIE